MPGHNTDAGRSNPVDRVFPHPIPRDGSADFHDRREELAVIQSVLLHTTRKPLLIRGERCIGKTTLLNHIRKWLETPPHNSRFRTISIEPGSVASWQEFASELWDGILACVESTGLEVPARLRAARESRTFGHYLADLRKLVAYLPGVTFVIFLDELDKIKRHCDSLQQTKILSLIRQLVESEDAPLAFVISVLREIPGQEGLGSPLAVEEMALPPFGEADTRVLEDSLLQGCAPLETEAHAWFYEFTGGHPYLAKLLLAIVLDQFDGAHMQTPLTAEDLRCSVNTASAARRKQLNDVLQNVYREYFNDSEREILLWLASQPSRRLTYEDLQPAQGRLKTAAEELVERHYLKSGENGSYEWRLGWLHVWFAGWPEYGSEIERLRGVRAVLPDEPRPGIVIDRATQTVWVDGEIVRDLAALEYRALVCLTERVSQVVSKDEFAALLHPDDACSASDESMSALVYRLRKKIHDEEKPPKFIETVRGRGFRIRGADFTTG